MARELPEYLPSLRAVGDAFAPVWVAGGSSVTGQGVENLCVEGYPRKSQAGLSQEHTLLTQVHPGVCRVGRG